MGGKTWKLWKDGKFGKSGGNFHNWLILNVLVLFDIVPYSLIIVLLMLGRVLMPFGHRTPRKRDSCFNISPSPSGFFSVSRKVLRTQRTRRTRRSQRTLFDGLIVPHGKTIKERLRV